MAQPISKFDKSASVSWSVAGPDGKPLSTNRRDFQTLREAILYVQRLPAGSRGRATIRQAGKSYDPVEVEELEKEMRWR
jgi:hypothetical protein